MCRFAIETSSPAAQSCCCAGKQGDEILINNFLLLILSRIFLNLSLPHTETHFELQQVVFTTLHIFFSQLLIV